MSVRVIMSDYHTRVNDVPMLLIFLDAVMCLSLQVSELKQLNRLISDQEVYGLRTIRVPVKRYGLVEELIRAEMDKEQSNVKLGKALYFMSSCAAILIGCNPCLAHLSIHPSFCLSIFLVWAPNIELGIGLLFI